MKELDSQQQNFIADLDDTLLNLKVPLMQALNLKTNKNIHWKDWDGHNLEKLYGISRTDFIDMMIESKVIERALPIPGVRESLQKIKDKGYEIHIITARGWHPNGMEITKQWLDENNYVYDTINIVKLGASKSDVMDTIKNARYIVDDNEDNCNEVIARGYDAYLIEMPWHTNSTLKRIKHIDELLDSL